MKILFLADHDVWPPATGSAQRLYYLSSGLARRHDVTLVIMSWLDGAARFPDAGLFTGVHVIPYASCRFATDTRFEPDAPAAVRLRRAMTSRTPSIVRRFESPLLTRTLQALREDQRFDVLWVTRGYFAEQALSEPGVPIVVDLPDIETESHRRAIEHETRLVEGATRRIELLRIRAWERRLPERFAAVTVCKREDSVHFKAGVGRVVVVPNGVPEMPAARADLERADEILFVGNLEYQPNVDAVLHFERDVLPLIRNIRASTRFVVVGKNPWSEVRVLDDGDTCLVHADVADLGEYYDAAAVVVVPMRLGSGTRIKFIEAMARGKAVVSTAIGAEGVDARPGVDYLRADSPEEFARACIALLGDRNRRHRLGRSGRDRMADSYQWDLAVDEADRALEGVVNAER